jgi:hypothetical protein
MAPVRRRQMTLLDAILLVSSAAIGMGAFQAVRRGLFQGWIWLFDQRFPDVHTWTTWDVIVTCSDITVFLIPLVGPWTVLLILLRMRSPRPGWRRICRQPGMTACLAALFGWCWSGLALILALDVGYVARPGRSPSAVEWGQKYLADEVFMYVGLAVAAVWFVQFFSGQWRRSADWIDLMGRLVGICWIVVGLVWTLREYLDFT